MNRNRLLTSTALVSAALVLGAGHAEALSLRLGGFAEFWFGYGDNDKAAGVNNDFDVKTDAQIDFIAEDTLSNGITVGLRFALEAGNGNWNGSGTRPATTANDGFNESYAWVKTRWGQVNIGNNDVATEYVGGVDTVGPVRIIKTDAEDWVVGQHAVANWDVDLRTRDSQNLTYFTPRVSGFQGIVSYAPDASDFADSDFDDQETTGTHNTVSFAARFDRKFGDIGVGLGAGYTSAEATDMNVYNTATMYGYNARLKLDIGPVRFTTAYALENLDRTFETVWGAGVIYNVNRVHAVSAGFSRGKITGDFVVDDHVLTFGWEGDMGKGVRLAASVFYWDSNRPGTVDDRDGWGAVGGIVFNY